MRHIRTLWIVTLAGLGTAFAQGDAAQPAAPPAEATATADVPTTAAGITFPQPAADDPVHDELRALQAAMEDALNKRDLDALLANVDDDLVFTAMNAETGYGKEHVKNYFHRMLNGPDKIVEDIRVDFVPDKLAAFYGPDVAVSAGNAASYYKLTNGMEFDVDARWTGTLVRKNGKWTVAAFHYSTNMFRNPVLDAQRNWLLMGGGAAALLLGILGFMIGRKSGRKPA